MVNNSVILWFRRDLRLSDNPALDYVSKLGRTIIPIYILDEVNDQIGAASRWWLHHSLDSLNKNLATKLNFFIGDPQKIITDIIAENNVTNIAWNRCYEPAIIARDTTIKEFLKNNNISVKTFNGSLLLEPHETLKDDKSNYKVFTPFYKKNYINNSKIRVPLAPSSDLSLQRINSLSLTDLSLIPKIKWYQEFEKIWQPGEGGANRALDSFMQNELKNYKELRDRPDLNHTSRLSPHLHFGEISPNIIWHKVKNYSENNNYDPDAEKFLTELVWRDFSYNILYFFSDLPKQNLQQKFDNFPWQENHELLTKWQKGETGYPIVDAGMRELWQTGFMHNRVRMIVASFLVKHLMIDWRHGADWFNDCLVDADLANNSASWQWVAGSGADAAPYFRIFNPILQGQKFDPKGVYTRKFVPELKNMPIKYLFSPWLAPASFRAGVNYPAPIIEHEGARKRALKSYSLLKNI